MMAEDLENRPSMEEVYDFFEKQQNSKFLSTQLKMGQIPLNVKDYLQK